MNIPCVRNLLFSISAVLLWNCAQVVPLSGGKRDTTPPKLIEAIPANKTTGFNQKEVSLKFDEFIQLKDLANQFIISPKIKTSPEITVQGKKLKIIFNDKDLKPNTTYQLYFGNAIADMNEGNVLEGLNYVFSTGSEMDSLKLSGQVNEASTNLPVENILVGLYNAAIYTDSVIYKEAPDYVTKTKSGGIFNFTQLPKGSYRLFAFSDKNKNQVYDAEIEQVAFFAGNMNMVADTNVKLKIFQELASKTFIRKKSAPYPGFGQIILNQREKVTFMPIKTEELNSIFEIKAGYEKDTISFYYKGNSDTLGFLLHYAVSGKRDSTTLVMAKNKKVETKKINNIRFNASTGNLALHAKPSFSFLNWMDAAKTNTDAIHLFRKLDSILVPVEFKGVWKDVITYELETKIAEGGNYMVKLDTAAFYGMNQRTNDSMKFVFKAQSKSELGKLSLKIKVNLKQQYLVQLLNEKEHLVQEQKIRFALSASNAATVDFIDVLPGNYHVKLIFDSNENTIWDTGKVITQKLPETVFIYSKQLKVLADWEVEEEIVIKD